MTGWLQKVNIKQFLTDEDVDEQKARQIGLNIYNYLVSFLPYYPDRVEFFSTMNQEEINKALTHLYDWADAHRVWLGL